MTMRACTFRYIFFALLIIATAPAWSQETLAPAALDQRIVQNFADGEYEKALSLIEKYLEDAPQNVVMLYNAACALSLLDRPDEATSYLIRAIKNGFTDLNQIVNDPDLKPIHKHPKYIAAVEELKKTAGQQADNALAHWRSRYGDEKYRYEKDEQRRLTYATALDPVSHQEMRKMIELEADQLKKTLFDVTPEYYVLIAVPTPNDANKLLDAPNIGGIYVHARRRLIVRDIGGAMRHEFAHVLHYAHMEKIKQKHPLWIQEGIASLYEDYKILGNGSFKFLPNERHNIVKFRSERNRLMKWEKLFSMSSKRFMSRAGQMYPQVRSMFEFVADKGKLSLWYKEFVDNFDSDKTGAIAFEKAFGMPLEEVEQSWKDWVASKPRIDTTISRGDASLGINSNERSSNDGVKITNILPGSAARRARLRVGDVIVSIDGVATRSMDELQAIIGSKKNGDKIRVRVRRRSEYLTMTVTLSPLR